MILEQSKYNMKRLMNIKYNMENPMTHEYNENDEMYTMKRLMSNMIIIKKDTIQHLINIIGTMEHAIHNT